MLPTKFGVSWPFGSGEEAKNRFLRWQPCWASWIYDQNFSYFDLLVTPMLPIKLQDKPFVSGEEAKNRFSRLQPSWTSHRNNFSYFLYACLKNGTYYVTGYGVCPFVRKLFRFRLLLLQFTSDEAETWFLVRP